MHLDLPHAASAIAFTHPVPAIMSLYEDKPVLSLVPFDNTYDVASSAAEQVIDELGKMRENWDGYGAQPFTDEVAQNAKAALRFMWLASPMLDVIPNPNGTISFEWDSERGSAHLEIGRTRLSFYLQNLDAKPILLQEDTNNILDVCRWVDQMIINYLYPAQTLALSAMKIGLPAYGRASTRYR